MAVADTALYKALSRLAIPQDVLLWDPSLDVSNEFALLIHICDITLVELIGHLIDAAQMTVSRSPLGSCYTIHFPPVANRHKHSKRMPETIGRWPRCRCIPYHCHLR